ncbi:unnamed protein product [Echinostoma caproni]|uniref:Ras-GEF domain-containing protein n=1 Tax=Echinostoma caproni TaxID=27848 RepID=A0A183AF50_9TREM|nr:unnamed protein product [Echinostoma caproni]
MEPSSPFADRTDSTDKANANALTNTVTHENLPIKSSTDRPSSSHSDFALPNREKHNYSCLPTPGTHQSEQKAARARQLTCINLVFCHICEVLKHLKQLKNFSSFLALLLAVQEVPEILLFKKSKSVSDDRIEKRDFSRQVFQLLNKFSSYMKPPMFTEYRRDLEAASLPYLPYLGLIFQQLIHLHAGNPKFLPDMVVQTEADQLNRVESGNSQVLLGVMVDPTNVKEQFVNMWRCWKHYLILGYFIKRMENPETARHRLPCNAEVQEILSDFKDRFSDTVLDKAKEQLIANIKPKKSFWTTGSAHN